MKLTPEFLAAIKQHRLLTEALGIDHPVTRRAFFLAMQLSPDELIDEYQNMALDMGLMPEACGYLADGSPMYRLEDIAERLEVSQEDAEETMHRMFAERKALGLHDANIVTDASLIYRKQ